MSVPVSYRRFLVEERRFQLRLQGTILPLGAGCAVVLAVQRDNDPWLWVFSILSFVVGALCWREGLKIPPLPKAGET